MAKIPDVTAFGPRPPIQQARPTPNIIDVGRGIAQGTETMYADARNQKQDAAQMAANMSSFSNEIAQAEGRIRTRADTVARVQDQGAYSEAAEAELRKVMTEGDLSRMDTVEKYGDFLKSKQEDIISKHAGSMDSQMALTARLDEMRSGYASRVASLSFEAQDKLVTDTLGGKVNVIASRTFNNPGQLAQNMADLDQQINDMSPALRPDQERSFRTAGRERLVENAIGGMIAKGGIADAEKALAMPGVSQVLGEAAQRRIQNQFVESRRAIAAANEPKSDIGKIAADVRSGLVPPQVGAMAIQTKVSDPTSLQRDLVAAGLTPGTPEYSKAMMAAILKPNAQVNIGEETSFEKNYGGKLAEQAAEIHSGAENSRKLTARLGQFDALSTTFETGKLAGAKTTVAAWADALKISPQTLEIVGLKPTDAINGQAMAAVSNAMLLSFLGPGGFPSQNFSDSDRAFLEKTLPTVSNTPGGNKIISQAMGAAAQRSLDKETQWLKAQDVAGNDANKAEVYRKFLREWNAHVKSTPLFPAIDSPEEMRKLKSGTVFTAPDGSLHVAP